MKLSNAEGMRSEAKGRKSRKLAQSKTTFRRHRTWKLTGTHRQVASPCVLACSAHWLLLCEPLHRRGVRNGLRPDFIGHRRAEGVKREEGNAASDAEHTSL